MCDLIEFNADVEVIDPKENEQNKIRNKYAELFGIHKKGKVTLCTMHNALMRERNYFASMMIKNGDADAMISGYSRNYRSVVKPILETIQKIKE